MREIALPGRHGKITLIDDEDRWVMRLCKWHASCVGKRHKRWYAISQYEGKTIYLHRVIMGEPEGMDVDHINGDGLDNRRANLRVTTRSQNSQNAHAHPKTGKTSRYKGVSWHKDKKLRSGGYWRAEIELPGRNRIIRTFHDEQEAARAYDVLAIQYFGEHARLNFPGEPLRYDLVKPPRIKASKYRGVAWSKHGKTWYAELALPNGKMGRKSARTEEAAARAYDALVVKHMGLAHRRVNFPGEPAQIELIKPKARHSRYRGVCWAKNARLTAGGQWIAYITGPDKKRITRYCHSELEAAHAYNALAKEYLDSTAPLNGV